MELDYSYDRLYQSDRKLFFIEKTVKTMSSFDTYKYIFDKTYIKERKQNKDICDFSLEEIEQFFRDCKYPVYSLRTYKNILRQYIDFAIDQKWTDRDSNPLVHSNSSWEREVAVNPPYYSDSDIQEILSRCVNAQDKVVIQLLFYELVGGDQCSEITNLRESDIDRKNNRLFLRDKHNTERYTYVSGETMTLLEEAIAQIEFINDNGNEHLKYKSQPLLENGYVLKPTPKGRKRDTLQPAYSLIHQRLKTLQTNLELKNFTYKKLFQAGMVFYAKKVYEEIGKVDIQKAIDVIYEKRGLKKTIAKNQYGLVYESIPSHHRQYVR
jgi:integrase